MIKFTPFPNISTNRLTLRQLKIEDENEIFFMRSDEGMLEFIDIPKAKNLEDVRAYIQMINKGIEENKWVFWGIALNENIDKLIGTICLWNISIEENKAEIGYVLHPDFQGKGIMQESSEKVIEYGFKTMNLNLIDAHLHSKNKKSLKLLERNHFVFEKEEKDMVVYALAKSWGAL
jgi:RimJ/RimL family protein N-acetyltransferase